MDDTPARPFYLLWVIILAQFFGTSLWFAGNAVLPDLQVSYQLPEPVFGWMTSAVQLGFITGTLVFAFFLIADRFSPSRVFLVAALAGAGFNLGMIWLGGHLEWLLAFRFLTGFFLAGIYPVGMKISADWYAGDLGKALGFLVGALVLGTAFPHFLRYQSSSLEWTAVIAATSSLAAAGGVLLAWLVPDGPFRKASNRFDPGAIARIFRFPEFRAAAFGYFGHMWELYAFWTFVPFLLHTYNALHRSALPVSLWSFLIIASGTLGCILGGYWSLRRGSALVAQAMLLVSGLACLLSPLFFQIGFAPVFLTLVCFWGFAVVGDSPQFSTLVARTAPPELKGSALTIVNSIGFAVTIFSIELLNRLAVDLNGAFLFLPLALGPIFGLRAIWGSKELD